MIIINWQHDYSTLNQFKIYFFTDHLSLPWSLLTTYLVFISFFTLPCGFLLEASLAAGAAARLLLEGKPSCSSCIFFPLLQKFSFLYSVIHLVITAWSQCCQMWMHCDGRQWHPNIGDYVEFWLKLLLHMVIDAYF